MMKPHLRSKALDHKISFTNVVKYRTIPRHARLTFQILLDNSAQFFFVNSKNSTSENSPELSIIIPAYNEEKRIERTLERIEIYLSTSGDHPDKSRIEIIIVNDG